MLFIASLVNLFLADVKTTLIGLLVFYLVYRVTSFYIRVYSLPPGPFPLPIVGNMFALRSGGQSLYAVLANIAKTYGPVFTIWNGESPRVVIADIDLLRDKFKKNEIAGRMMGIHNSCFLTENRKDIAGADYGPNWEALRRVAHAAVLRYALSEKLNDLVIDCFDHNFDLMVKTEGLDKQFVPFDYFFSTFLNISAAIAFGHRYDFSHPEYKVFEYALSGMFIEFNDIIGIWDSFWFTRFGKRFNKFRKAWDDFANLCITKFVDHYKDYDENVIRDFCDTLITAKNEAIKAGKESAPYLTDNNLGMVCADLIFAGTDTSENSFRWMVLHMLYNRECFERLRHEIDVEIGDRMPTHEDKTRCHYVMAFMSEMSRHSNINPLAEPHKAVVTCKLGEYTIPKGTEVVGFQGYIMRQAQHFPDPDVFRPERFLQHNGHYVDSNHKAFIPFGVGRRNCLGEKLAIADLFLVLVRFIQKTNKYRIGLHMNDKEPLLPDPVSTNLFAIPTKEFKISFNTN